MQKKIIKGVQKINTISSYAANFHFLVFGSLGFKPTLPPNAPHTSKPPHINMSERLLGRSSLDANVLKAPCSKIVGNLDKINESLF